MVGPRSNDINRQLCKLVANINNYGRTFTTCCSLHPHLGQITVVLSQGLPCASKMLAHLKRRLAGALEFVNNFVPYLVYQGNLMTFSMLRRRNSEFTHHYLWTKEKNEFYKVADIIELLPLMNVSVRYEDTGPANRKEDTQEVTCQKILDLVRRQAQSKEAILFAEPSKYESGQPINEYFGLEEIQARMKPPVLKEEPERAEVFSVENVLRGFNTIEIRETSEPRLAAQGGWSKLMYMEITFIYAVSEATIPPAQLKSPAMESMRSEELEQLMKGTIKRRILAKMPQDTQDQRRFTNMASKIKYEKHILQQFRGAQTKLLPKYYHTVQSSLEISQYILMDFIQANPVS